MLKTPLLLSLAVASMTAVVASAVADDGPLVLRVRAIDLRPSNRSDAIGALGVPADKIDVSSKWIPDFDLEYYFAPQWSTELVLTVPQQHDVSVAGVGALGTFKHLPPTLTAKYHFNAAGTISPYLGAGINLTLIYDANLAVPAAITGSTALPLHLDNRSVGAAAQAGVDIRLNERWSANLDAKYVQIQSAVKLADGTKVSEVHVDPWLLGVGLAYRF